MKSDRLRQIAVYLLAAVVVAFVLHMNLLARLSVNNAEKVGMPLLSSRTDPSDNYVYFNLLKLGLSACHRPAVTPPAYADNISGNPLACTYIGGLIVGHVLWLFAKAITLTDRMAISVLLVLNSALMAFAFLLAVSAVLRRNFGLASSIALAGICLYAIDNFGLWVYYGNLSYKIVDVLGLEPGFARLVSPAIF
jgi:hypothetical protein